MTCSYEICCYYSTVLIVQGRILYLNPCATNFGQLYILLARCAHCLYMDRHFREARKHVQEDKCPTLNPQDVVAVALLCDRVPWVQPHNYLLVHAILFRRSAGVRRTFLSSGLLIQRNPAEARLRRPCLASFPAVPANRMSMH